MRQTSISIMAGLAVALLTVSGCGGGKGGPGSGVARPQAPNINDVFARGVELHEAEDCRKAVPHLFKAAFQGPGYEDAQWRLGECLMRRGQPTISSTPYLEGLVWTRRAAEAGWPEAQARLAVAYANEGLWKPVEAAMWLTLSNRNVQRSRIGFVALSPETVDEIRARLSPAQMAEGEKRADGWKKTVWRPPAKQRAGSFAETGERKEGGPGKGQGRRGGKGQRGEQPLS